MKRVVSILTLFAVTAFAAGLGSCAKTQKADTLEGRIPGKWKKMKYATDDNISGTIDSWEIHPVEAGVDNVFTVNSDHTGVELTNNFTLNFTWTLAGDVLTCFKTGHDTTAYRVTGVSTEYLILTTDTKLGLAWYYYGKSK